jgi:hypothetical protein
MMPVAFLILKTENDFETSFVPVVMGILSTIPDSLYGAYIWRWFYFGTMGGFEKTKNTNIDTANIS